MSFQELVRNLFSDEVYRTLFERSDLQSAVVELLLHRELVIGNGYSEFVPPTNMANDRVMYFVYKMAANAVFYGSSAYVVLPILMADDALTVASPSDLMISKTQLVFAKYVVWDPNRWEVLTVDFERGQEEPLQSYKDRLNEVRACTHTFKDLQNRRYIGIRLIQAE